MESGAKGCEVIVSGKLRAQRAKAMKFKDGYMIASGHPAVEYIDGCVRHVMLRQGVLGIKVSWVFVTQLLFFEKCLSASTWQIGCVTSCWQRLTAVIGLGIVPVVAVLHVTSCLACDKQLMLKARKGDGVVNECSGQVSSCRFAS